MITDKVRLNNARLVAELHEDRRLPFLLLRNSRQPGRGMLLPLRKEPLCAAMARFTPLGRLHALYWSLAYGHAEEEQPSGVSFSCLDRPYRRVCDADLVLLGDHWWLADVEGIFTSVTVHSGASTMAQAAIPSATRG